MPTFNMTCPGCSMNMRVLAASWEQVKKVCKICGGVLHRKATGPNTRTMEVLDNGLMPRAVERLARAEELSKERARDADPNAGAAIHKVG